VADTYAADTYTVVQAGPDRLDEAGPLFRAMVDHHRELTGRDWPVRDRGEAWRLRRQQYADWLASGQAWLLLAVAAAGPGQPAPAPSQPAAGYAFVRLAESGPTWDLGPRAGELESLSVAPAARGHGIGGLLIGAARELLRSQGISYWSVSVAGTNTGAVRLYERAGFQPFNLQMLAPL
jgi:ribosomal protein S18 acetylase RimI-like enzyme